MNYILYYKHENLNEQHKNFLYNKCWLILTCPFSTSLLSIIMAFDLCSQTIRQKWPEVCSNGPYKNNRWVLIFDRL